MTHPLIYIGPILSHVMGILRRASSMFWRLQIQQTRGRCLWKGYKWATIQQLNAFLDKNKTNKKNMINTFNHNIMIFRKEGAIRIIIQPSTKMRRLVGRRTRRKRSRMVRRRRRMKMNLENTRTSRWLCWTQNTKLRVRILLLTATEMLINKEILSLRIHTSWAPTTTTWTTGFPRPLRSSANLDPCILRHTTRAPTGVVETIMFKW